ncbi:hypothetical protein LXL04_034350 [Taraxacum kok-saghyz]
MGSCCLWKLICEGEGRRGKAGFVGGEGGEREEGSSTFELCLLHQKLETEAFDTKPLNFTSHPLSQSKRQKSSTPMEERPETELISIPATPRDSTPEILTPSGQSFPKLLFSFYAEIDHSNKLDPDLIYSETDFEEGTYNAELLVPALKEQIASVLLAYVLIFRMHSEWLLKQMVNNKSTSFALFSTSTLDSLKESKRLEKKIVDVQDLKETKILLENRPFVCSIDGEDVTGQGRQRRHGDYDIVWVLGLKIVV